MAPRRFLRDPARSLRYVYPAARFPRGRDPPLSPVSQTFPVRVFGAILLGGISAAAMAAPEYGTSVLISEFLASNGTGLTDQFGLREDWIELHNPTAAAVNLNGWYLTGTAANLKKWRFPAVSLPAGGYLVVFASNRNLINPANPLHTNFKLGASGEYLALVRPDGVTVVSEFTPVYPAQATDISYGITPVPGTPQTLLSAGAQAEILIPDAPPPTDWRLPAYTPGAGWFSGVSGVGYDVGAGSSGGAEILYVVNQQEGPVGQAGDQSVIDRLTGTLGHVVTVVDDAAVTAADAEGKDLVMVSSTVLSSEVGTKFRNVTVPVINWERDLADDFLLSSAGTSIAAQTSITITGDGATHPLGAGLPAGAVVVRNNSGSISAASNTNRAPDAVVVATSSSGQPVVMMVEEGMHLHGNVPAPADRFHLFLNDEGVAALTANGLAIFDACVDHALRDFTPPSPYAAWIARDVEEEMHEQRTSAYLRFSFTPDTVANLRSLQLKMRADDGYVAWLNGVEIARRNAPTTPAWNSIATAAGDGLTVETLDVSAHLGLLVAGEQNTLAIHALNVSAGDDDFLVLPELVAGTQIEPREDYYVTPTPAAANEPGTLGIVPDVAFSAERGYFSTPFQLTLSNSLAGTQIRYTTDGSAPTATTGTVYTAPIPISTTATVRACAYRTGYTSLRPETRTFLYLPDIVQQPATIAGWPNPTISVATGTRVHDYQMDPELTGDPAFQQELIAGMTEIPTLSVVVKQSQMWSASGTGGFYRGTDNEQPASVEFINPANPEENLQADCGIRGHSHDRMKRSLRLSFKSTFGESKLDSPIFTGVPWRGESGNREVDNVVLRAGNNHSFARSWNPTTSTYGEDEWYRATQIAMGQAGSPGRFVHLYINGLYWGLYNAVQRPDADFAAGELGGTKEDWFSVSHSGVHGEGSSLRWDYLTGALTDKNMAIAANYAELGEYVDLPSFVDYLLCAFFTGMDDWPENNWWGGNRNSPAGPFHFFAWDGETAWGTGNGSHPTARVHPAFSSSLSNPGPTPAARIWHAARKNPDFLALVADRLHKHTSAGGALSTAAAVARWDQIHDHIARPIYGESARWGDTMQEPPSRPQVEWINEVNRVRNVMLTGTSDGSGTTENAEILKEEMLEEGYFPALEAPAFSQDGGEVPAGFLLSMTNPGGTGSIHYTLDGTDPRLPGGALSPSATTYTAPVAIGYTLVVKARVKQGTSWSAVHERTFVSEGPAPLRVTEIMYHPAAPDAAETAQGYLDNEAFEFLEFRNNGSESINLAGAHFTSGLTFTFGERIVPPGGTVLLVKDEGAFIVRYGPEIAVDGEFTGNLDNAGERLHLKSAAGHTLIDITYDDVWHPSTDGGGHSLVPVDVGAPLSTWTSAAGWRPSYVAGGSPGEDDVEPPLVMSYPLWREEHFSEVERADEGVSGAEADADRDGWANLLEYVFGTDPRIPQSTQAGADGGVTRGAPRLEAFAGGWRWIYARRKAEQLAGLAVVAQESGALVEWQGIAGSPAVIGSDDDVEIFAVELPETTDPARFYRLSATLLPP